MRFEWDEAKKGRNLLKHDVRFETAVLVFDDPYALTQRDESSDEEQRWITLGMISPGALLVVVHTWFEREGEEIIRIISARAAESHERRNYDDPTTSPQDRCRGIGCVRDVRSPGTSLCGTGFSMIGHTGFPVTRSKTKMKPCLVGATTASMAVPPRWMVTTLGGAGRS